MTLGKIIRGNRRAKLGLIKDQWYRPERQLSAQFDTNWGNAGYRHGRWQVLYYRRRATTSDLIITLMVMRIPKWINQGQSYLVVNNSNANITKTEVYATLVLMTITHKLLVNRYNIVIISY